MATDNSELVDTQFLMDYLNSTRFARKRLDQESLEALLNILSTKCEEESTMEFIIDQQHDSKIALNIVEHYDVPVLESLLVRKWTDGKKVNNHQLAIFGKCKEIIKKDSTWSEEQEAHFVEKSLDRIE